MKKFIKSTLLLIAVVLGLSMTACNSGTNDIDTVTEQSFQSCYVIVTDLTGADKLAVKQSVVIQLNLNWTKGLSEVNITGLAIGGQTYPAVKIKDMQWGVQEDGWGSVVCKSPTMEASASGITPTVTDFRLRWLDRLDFAPYVGIYDPGCEFSFIVDGRYHVVGSRQPFVLAGKTKTTDDAGKIFETLKPVYTVGLDFTTNMATIVITKSQFVEDMPPLTMKFSNIPFTIADGGTRFVLQSDALTPSISGTPYPDFPISELHADIIPGTGMVLSFKCNYRKAKMYTVDVDVDYSNYQTAITE